MRAVDLFDAIIENLTQRKSSRAKEVLRAKEVFLNSVYGNQFDEKDASSFEKYLYEFALVARRHK